MSGVRAREYPAHLVARVAEHNDASVFGLMGKFLGYFHALDRGGVVQAGVWLEEVVAGAAAMPVRNVYDRSAGGNPPRPAVP
jgi:hypothetical protein